MNKSVELMNRLFRTDPNAVHALLINRVPCNEEFSNDPDVPVDNVRVFSDPMYQVGALGLINGILSANGQPMIAVMWSERDADGCSKMIGFCEYTEVKRYDPQPKLTSKEDFRAIDVRDK